MPYTRILSTSIWNLPKNNEVVFRLCVCARYSSLWKEFSPSHSVLKNCTFPISRDSNGTANQTAQYHPSGKRKRPEEGMWLHPSQLGFSSWAADLSGDRLGPSAGVACVLWVEALSQLFLRLDGLALSFHELSRNPPVKSFFGFR